MSTKRNLELNKYECKLKMRSINTFLPNIMSKKEQEKEKHNLKQTQHKILLLLFLFSNTIMGKILPRPNLKNDNGMVLHTCEKYTQQGP